MIVVDTNILSYFWLPSDHSKICDELFQWDSNWVAPILWRSEFRNVMSLYLRRDLITFSEALSITEKVEDQMKDREFQVNSFQVYSLVSKSTCSAYDCEFVCLAQELNTKLVTMDNQILNAFPETAVKPADLIN